MRERIARGLHSLADRLDEGAERAEKHEREPFPRLYVLFGSLAAACFVIAGVAALLVPVLGPGLLGPAVGFGLPGLIMAVFAGAAWAEHT